MNRLVPVFAALAGFAVGVGQCATPWVDRDVRNKVYEATFLDKERALKTQADLLSLQDTYSLRLHEVRELEQKVNAGLDEAKRVREEGARRLDLANQQLRAGRGYYRDLEQKEQARITAEKQTAEGGVEPPGADDLLARHRRRGRPGERARRRLYGITR